MLPYREHLEEQFERTGCLVSVNYRRTAGKMVTDHWHPCQELLFVFGGEASQTIDGLQFPLHTGDTLLIAPGAVHATTALEDDCYIGVMAFFHTTALPSTYLPAGSCPDVKRIFSVMQEEATLRRPGHVLLTQGLLWESLGLIQRYGRILQPLASSSEGRRLEEFIRANLSRSLTLESAAAFAGYSPAYFSRYFSKLMGQSFKSYVDQMKMQAAKNMLSDGIPVTETALALGYETASSFCRAFKRLTGQTPSTYQETGQKMDRTE